MLLIILELNFDQFSDILNHEIDPKCLRFNHFWKVHPVDILKSLMSSDTRNCVDGSIWTEYVSMNNEKKLEYEDLINQSSISALDK